MTTLYDVQTNAENFLNKMRDLFVPESELTFIVRLPSNDNSDILISNDEIDELIKLLESMKDHSSNKR